MWEVGSKWQKSVFALPKYQMWFCPRKHQRRTSVTQHEYKLARTVGERESGRGVQRFYLEESGKVSPEKRSTLDMESLRKRVIMCTDNWHRRNRAQEGKHEPHGSTGKK